MSLVIPRSHPYWLVRSVVERRNDVVAVPASYYTYLPRTVADTRSEWLIPTEEFLNPERMLGYMEQTPEGQEMAVHSNIMLASQEPVHLVMIDMATSSKAHLEKLRVFLGDNFFYKISWYDSGRSFHGYGDSILTEADWVKFMGLLLLANQPNLEPTVDPRWIGHRLLAGYASLRWTNHSRHYLRMPASLTKTEDSSGTRIYLGLAGKKSGTI